MQVLQRSLNKTPPTHVRDVGGGYSTAVKIVNLWRLTPYHVGAIKASPTSEELTDEEY